MAGGYGDAMRIKKELWRNPEMRFVRTLLVAKKPALPRHPPVCDSAVVLATQNLNTDISCAGTTMASLTPPPPIRGQGWRKGGNVSLKEKVFCRAKKRAF
jgi:hypothetical protein